MENSVRLSSYIEARKAGAPREDAATLAKDLTVNFNRKGEDSATVMPCTCSLMRLFRGNVNIMQALSNDGSSGKRFGGKKRFTGFDYTTAQALRLV